MKTISKSISRILLGAIFTLTLVNVKVSAQNSTGNVYFNSWTDQQSKTITMRCEWNENHSWIQPSFYWDTVPGLFRNHSTLPAEKFYDSIGGTSYLINSYSGCQSYYMKLEFIDGQTGIKQTVHNYTRTQGDKKPQINNFHFQQIGFNFAEMVVSVDGFCNGFSTEIKIAESGKLSNTQYNENWYEKNENVSRILYGLEPNKDYILTVIFSNNLGNTTYQTSFRTMSNLVPTVESTNTMVDTTNAICNVFVDSKNTQALWNIEYGESIDLSESTGWYGLNYSSGNYGIQLQNLKPGTVYFWRPVIKNDFGQNSGKTRMFRTKGNATGIDEVASEAVKIYPNPFNDKITIESKIGSKFVFIDINGRIIYEGSTKSQYEELTIDIPTGIYILQITNGEKITHQKLIKE